MGKAGGCAASQCEAIGRLVSLAWRSGVQARQAVKQMIGITCHKPAGFGDNRVTSCADAVAKAIQMHMLTDEEMARHTQNGGACPECGGPVEHEGGCCVCHACGYSECA
jgi:ribonucleoside-diphosphate reductase alpha chain